jgi:hypothetical protein
MNPEDIQWYFFPIKNEQGFKVESPTAYMHLINTLIDCTVELEPEYPDKKVLVVYEV